MQHEFTLKVLYRDVGKIIAALNAIGVHQLFYTIPIEIVPDENGYDYVENENIPTDLKIYIDPEQLPEFQIQIKEALSPYDYELTEQAAAAAATEEGPACSPIELRNSWVICSPQQTAAAHSSERYLLYDPRGSLGTELNGTTRGCLEFILMEDFTGKSVLDLGTGSGILSAAAGVKNAAFITPVDIEPLEEEVNHHFAVNGLKTNVSYRCADITGAEWKPDQHYDWIFMNITARHISQAIQKGNLLDYCREGCLISGLVDWNYRKMDEYFTCAGFIQAGKMEIDGWVTLLFKRGEAKSAQQGIETCC